MQRRILPALMLVLLLPACAQDDPVDPVDLQASQVEAQGKPAPQPHTYVLQIPGGWFSWEAAKTWAEGDGGHLVAITSAAENDAVKALLVAEGRFRCWIGLYQAKQAKEPDAAWKWVTREPIKYSNWYEGKPNDLDGVENGDESYGEILDDGTWNDIYPDYLNECFIVEYDYPAQPAALSISPSSYDFGGVPIGSSSPMVRFTVTNVGGLTSGGVHITPNQGQGGDFETMGFSCSGVLLVGQSCWVDMRFTPTTSCTGSPSITLSASAVPGGTSSAALSGTCIVPWVLGEGFGSEQFALIPAGTFQMGDITGIGLEHERPVHTVNITKAFFVQKTEVTQGQWKAVMGSNPAGFSSCGDLCPVERVSWDEVQAFLATLNATDPGKNYRLPTEAEWEYACRATTSGDFGGTGVPEEMGWIYENSGLMTHPVAQKQANAWGLFDMHGNVAEWVQD